MSIGEMRRFRRDPLRFIENLHRNAPSGAFRLPWGGACVGDPELTRKLLDDRAIDETCAGVFGTTLPARPVWRGIATAVRDFLTERLPLARHTMATAAAELPPTSVWPAAGTELVYHGTIDLLLSRHHSRVLRRLLAQAAHEGVLIRPAHFWQRARAEVVRANVFTELTAHVRRRRREREQGDAPTDVMDVILDSCPDELTDRHVANVYMLLFLSIVGTIGHSVAWTVLLACSNQNALLSWPIDWVVREAMRHRPVTWMVGHPVSTPIEIGGITVRAGEVVSVCPYLVHHDGNWAEPENFRPQRWAEPDGRGLYLPYSAGPFSCAGGAIAHTLITDAVTAIVTGAELTVTGGDLRPIVTNAASPRPFLLHRTVDIGCASST